MTFKNEMFIAKKNLKITKLKAKFKKNLNKIRTIQIKIEAIKKELNQIKKKQLNYYNGLLKEGTDYRKEGLIWIIKTIWHLGNVVDPEKFPPFLDNDAIHYLLKFAKLSMNYTQLQTSFRMHLMKKNKAKMRVVGKKFSMVFTGTTFENFNSTKKKHFLSSKHLANGQKIPKKLLTDEIINRKYKSKPEDSPRSMIDTNIYAITSEMEILGNQMRELKRNEFSRLLREFGTNTYKIKYGVTMEKVMTAMFGYEGLHIKAWKIANTMGTNQIKI